MNDIQVVLALLAERISAGKVPSAATSGSQNLSAYAAARLIVETPALYADADSASVKAAAFEAIKALEADGEIERFEAKGTRWRIRNNHPPLPGSELSALHTFPLLCFSHRSEYGGR